MAVTVTPYFCVNGAAEALEFYKRAFAAQERYRIPWEGRIGHAEIVIGETVLFLSDEAPDLGVLSPTTLRGNSVSFTLSVPEAEAAFQRALDAGATVERPLKNEPYGRTGWVIDPFGHRWAIQTPNPDFKPEDM
jgi:PhnB protein